MKSGESPPFVGILRASRAPREWHAHRLTDEGRYALGHRSLGDGLEGKEGYLSEDVHMHWHMGVFELELGEWNAARTRSNEYTLPAVERGDAKTDAPAMLWRLRLDASKPVALPWELVQRYAVEGLKSEADEFIVLHHLLALAGAGEVLCIDRWLDAQAELAATRAVH